MQDLDKLKSLSVDELRAELDARKSENRLAVAQGESLKEFDNETIIKVLQEKQKVIYGTDDRVDVFQLTDQAMLADADSVVALFRANNVVDNGNGTSTLTTQNFGAANNLCQNEPFRNQPIGAFCSGFLVAPDVIATAGHCVNANNVTNVRFVFGFRMQNATTAQVVISNAEIYRGVRMIGRQEVSNGPDWALVRIDRQVTNHAVVTIRRNGRIANGQAVHVIGHPSGLPLKFADGASVRNNQSNAFFVANLDTYGGNSGSPVFNTTNHVVEGILVRGEADFVQQGNCSVSLVCPNTGCRGEDCTRTTEFANVLAPQGAVVVRRSTGTRFSANEDWTGGPYFGRRGTFFADVTGDGSADAIVINDDRITVRRSNGTSFGPNEDWTGGPFFGTRGTFFADVTGDGKADAIVVNDDTIVVRRSTGSSFGPNEDWTGEPFFGTRGTFFADVTGDGKADAIVVNNDTVVVRRSTGSSFGPNEDWTGGPYFGRRGIFFADVTGDGRADAIVINDDRITVRRSNGTSFGPNEDWTGGPFFGTRGTFFADVTGDGKADAIVVNDDTVVVRRSTGSSFGPNEDWTGGPYFGSLGTFFADVTGDGKSDGIVVND